MGGITDWIIMPRVIINGMSNWEELSTGILQGSVLEPSLFNIFIKALEDGINTDYTKLGGKADTLVERIRIQNGLKSIG